MEIENILEYCTQNNSFIKKVVDDFILDYAAARYGLEKNMIREFYRYDHIVKLLGEKETRMFMGQYLAHRIFRENGLLKKLLKDKRVIDLPAGDLEFLKYQLSNPWRFSFSRIFTNVGTDLYIMEDVFTDECFLLHSPGVTKTLQEKSVSLWFSLYSFNGECWQSYGPISAYSSFEADDIFFYGTEISTRIIDENDLLDHIDYDPVSYMMLISGADMKPVYTGNDRIVEVQSEIESSLTDPALLEKDFKAEYDPGHGIYRFTLKRWGGPPHFSTVYFDEKRRVLRLTSMTDRGYSRLAEKLMQNGIAVPEEPYIRASVTIIVTASQILNRALTTEVYSHYFSNHEEEPPEMDMLRDYLDLAIPFINSGQYPDVKKLAAMTGTDPEEAEKLTQQVWKKLRGN